MSSPQLFTVEPLGDGRFRARADESWVALQGINGGFVAAAALRAVEQVLAAGGVDAGATLRAVTLGYVSGTRVGELDIDVQLVRRGRSLVTSHARVSQDGRPTTVARFHHSSPWDGAAFSDAPPPASRPDRLVRVDWPLPVHLSQVETYMAPGVAPFAGAARAEWSAWSRPLGGDVFDSSWLVMFGDYFPPAVFTRSEGPTRAVTIEYSMQIHSAAGRWELAPGELLAARLHAFHSSDGFAVEDGWFHLPDGTLLATTRQTRLAG